MHGDKSQPHVTGHCELEEFVGRGIRSWPTVDQRDVHFAVLEGQRFSEFRRTNHLRVTFQRQLAALAIMSCCGQVKAILTVLCGGCKVLPRGEELSVEGSLQNPGGGSGGISALDDQVENLVDLRGEKEEILTLTAYRVKWR